MAAYSKSQVNRAGRFLQEGVPIGQHNVSELLAAIDAIDWWRRRHARPLARVNAGLRYYVRKTGPSPMEVTQRLKRFATIIDKLDREPRMALTRMEDIGGVRAVLVHQRQVDAVAAELMAQSRWEVRRTRRYVEGCEPGPKDDGYRAVHVIVERDGCFVEIQLRTPWQDAWAQSVEQDTRRLDTALKFGDGPEDLREYYVAVSEFMAMRERLVQPSQEFMEHLANLFASTRQHFPTDEEDRAR